MDSKIILAQCLRSARAAGAILKSRFRKKLKISHKPGAGLVTDADLAAQKKAIGCLQSLKRDWNLIAEEDATKDWPAYDPKKRGTLFLDPLDGTTNFVHGFPMFCVSLGAAWDGKLVAGVVWNPVLKDLFTARAGRGTFYNGKRVQVSRTEQLSDALLTTGFGYQREGAMHASVMAFERASLAARAIRRPGSAALDLAYTSAGIFDGYWEGELKAWDIMAGILLVQEAGGTVTDLTGERVRLDSVAIAASNGKIQKPLLDLVRTAR